MLDLSVQTGEQERTHSFLSCFVLISATRVRSSLNSQRVISVSTFIGCGVMTTYSQSKRAGFV